MVKSKMCVFVAVLLMAATPHAWAEVASDGLVVYYRADNADGAGNPGSGELATWTDLALEFGEANNGKTIYRKRLGATGHYRSSPVIANGHLYVVSEKGVVSVVKTGDDFELPHQHDFQRRVSATPAIDGSTVYIRTKTQLFAFRSK